MGFKGFSSLGKAWQWDGDSQLEWFHPISPKEVLGSICQYPHPQRLTSVSQAHPLKGRIITTIWGPDIKIHESVGPFHIQTKTVSQHRILLKKRHGSQDPVRQYWSRGLPVMVEKPPSCCPIAQPLSLGNSGQLDVEQVQWGKFFSSKSL